jgi:hypothetical protein
MTSPTDRLRRVGLVAAAVVTIALLGVVAVETFRYVQERVATALAPILGAALGAALFLLVVWFLWHLLKDPTKRLAERTRDEIDYRVERARAQAQLERRIAALDEELQVRALSASARVHENASRAVSEARLQRELEELKARSEQVVLRAQSVEIARMLTRYEAAYHRLRASPSMTAAEKADLLADLRAQLTSESSAVASG